NRLFVHPHRELFAAQRLLVPHTRLSHALAFGFAFIWSGYLVCPSFPWAVAPADFSAAAPYSDRHRSGRARFRRFTPLLSWFLRTHIWLHRALPGHRRANGRRDAL